MQHFYDSLSSSNKAFRNLVEELLDEHEEINIRLSENVQLGGMRWQDNGDIQLVFASASNFMDENMILEEFFHAFQFQFYGSSRFTKGANGKIFGGSNLEYEAKLFKAILKANQGKPINETPSQKGLVNFLLSLLNDKGEFKEYKFNTKQHDEYIKLVKHFQQHWKIRNKNENQKNYYDHPVDINLSPKACFYILSK